MIDKEKIKALLSTAVYAPSGDNSQPWSFEVEKNSIYVFNKPDLDNPLFNYRQRGSYVAHGALIENISVCASEMGFTTDLTVFPDINKVNCIAKITLLEGTGVKNNLFSCVTSRATNRKFYKIQPLAEELKNFLLESLHGFKECQLIFKDDKNSKQILGQAASLNEVVMLEEDIIRESFFNHIVWHKAIENKLKSGLFLETLEFNPIQKFIFKLLSIPKIAKYLIKANLAKFIASQNAKLYSSGMAFGAIVIENKDEKFITAGRVLQRVWLRLQSRGLSLQPLAGIAYFAQQVESGNTQHLSKKSVDIIKSAYQDFKKTFEIKNGVIGMVFRFGFGGQPSARSSKKQPEIVFKD